MTTIRVLAAIIAPLALAGPASAVDGVIEINQAAVFAGGITPGDMSGFPATLSQAGSYRLTGNLDVTKMQNGNPQPGSANITAIEVTADDVTLDLNGFALIGPATCTDASPPVCSSTGTGIGVQAKDRQAVSIINGVVRGLGGYGIRLEDCSGAHIEGVRVTNVGQTAIACGTHCQVIANNVRNCGFNCIDTSDEAIVRGNAVLQAINLGIITRGGGVVSGNTVQGTVRGISASSGTVTGNLSSDNREFGVDATLGTVILGNTILNNSNLGIRALNPALIGFGQNVINDNNGGNANPQTTAGMREIPAGSNVCGGDLICP